MSANIFGDRLLLRREPAWHNVGEVFDAAEKLTATEAAKRARVDFPIEKWPLQAIDPVTGKDLATNQYAVVRGPMDLGPTEIGLRIWNQLQPSGAYVACNIENRVQPPCTSHQQWHSLGRPCIFFFDK